MLRPSLMFALGMMFAGSLGLASALDAGAPAVATSGTDQLPGPLPPYLPVVPGLNADALDDFTAADFALAGHVHDDRYYTETESDDRFLGRGAKAADADHVDGLDSGQLLRSDASGTLNGNLDVRGSISFHGQKVCAYYAAQYTAWHYGSELVPPGWTAQKCMQWANNFGASGNGWVTLGCIFDTDFKLGSPWYAQYNPVAPANLPTPNCGW